MSRLFITCILLCSLSIIGSGQIPRTLSYQGVLTDPATGKPKPDGNYVMTFSLYTTSTGGSPLWSESKSVGVKGGLFITVLGDQNPISTDVKFDQPYYLGIQVAPDAAEMTHRIPLTSVAYSLNAPATAPVTSQGCSVCDTTHLASVGAASPLVSCCGGPNICTLSVPIEPVGKTGGTFYAFSGSILNNFVYSDSANCHGYTSKSWTSNLLGFRLDNAISWWNSPIPIPLKVHSTINVDIVGNYYYSCGGSAIVVLYGWVQ